MRKRRRVLLPLLAATATTNMLTLPVADEKRGNRRRKKMFALPQKCIKESVVAIRERELCEHYLILFNIMEVNYGVYFFLCLAK